MTSRMTDKQFAALAALIRLQLAKPSAQAARLHFVAGYRIAESARLASCPPNAANNAVRRCRLAIALAKILAT